MNRQRLGAAQVAAAGETTNPSERATVADVLIPVAIDTAYSYRIPPRLDVAAGDFVVVPLGPRETLGVVWEARAAVGGDNLKAIGEKLDWRPLQEPLRRFVDWLAQWTLSPRGMVLRMAIRVPDDVGPEPVRIGLRRAGPLPRRLTPARNRVLQALPEGAVLAKRALAEAARCSVGVIDGLVDDGTLEPVALPREGPPPPPDPDHRSVALEPEQREVADALTRQVQARSFGVTLLEGVTGSGKTEVYFEAVASALRGQRQALILLPEIALTAQFLDRFAARFGTRPAEWHSAVPSRKRARTWAGVAAGEVQVVVGARSSLFLPFKDLGLVVVDEEHEVAYKQEEGVTYHARDMAVVRARLENAAVVLASATPSIETRVNAESGRYAHARLFHRIGGRRMPAIEAIDLRKEQPPRGRWIAERLVGAVQDTVGRGEQALLFLNRRGYAPLTLCRTCGHRFTCAQCSAWLVEHRFRKALVCHHCGHVERRPDHCPACGEVDSLAACGPGVERIAEEAVALFPEARTLVLSSDFLGSTDRLREELAAVARREVDIVIGTQLVAKGHHFPHLTLAGIIDADVGLANGDLRAAERTFQLLQQVTGRAGRGEISGRALVQTWQPQHPVMRALLTGDAERFYATEIASRRNGGFPPFGRLAALIVSGPDRAKTEAHGRALARSGFDAMARLEAEIVPKEGAKVDVLGPSEAPLAMIRGRYRYRLLVKAPRSVDLQAFLRSMIAGAPKAREGVKVAVDVDPQSFV